MRPHKYPIEAGLQISLDGINWFKLTDHNRQEIQSSPEIIEKQSRMANGKLRKYVVAQKEKISCSWDFVPSKTDSTVDGFYSSEWLEAFYKANVFIPIYVKVVSSNEVVPSIGFYPNESTRVSGTTGYVAFNGFITNFSKNILKRTSECDFVNMSIEFTEI